MYEHPAISEFGMGKAFASTLGGGEGMLEVAWQTECFLQSVFFRPFQTRARRRAQEWWQGLRALLTGEFRWDGADRVYSCSGRRVTFA